MKKLSKILAVAISLVFILSSSICTYADGYSDYVDSLLDDVQSEDYKDDDLVNYYDDYYYQDEYTIDKYDVNIIVNEDNTFNITENIVANFNVPKHGIYRYIPVQNNVERTDGTSTTIKARITDVTSNMPIYDDYTQGENYVIQLGEEDVELTGSHNYQISYTYQIPMDTVEGADELYYNFIGTGWDTTIDNVTFSITMPKEFDASKIGFSTGTFGAEGTDIVKFKVNGNTISGKLTEQLGAYEGATIRIELEEGYFTFNAFSYYIRYVGMIAFPLLALIVVLILWAKYGRDKKIVDVVEFYPPNNLNCAELAFWYKGMIANTDVVPMVIELANEGYLRIEEVEINRKLFKDKKTFKFVWVKNYYGGDPLKKIFFNDMFSNGRISEVYEEDLEDCFYKTINEITNKVTSENKTKVFNKGSLTKRIVGWVVSLVAGFLSVCVWANTTYGMKLDLIAVAVGVGLAVLSFIFAFFIRQRTDDGYVLKQKINGFKLFIETAEKERLEALVSEDPSYFYNILPYAYVLGVSDVWTKKFESIAMQPPHWYYSNRGMWDYMMFSHFMHSTMNTANKVFVSQPKNSGTSSGGGSFSGGGGFSGGGFGGGGGGSW